MKYKSNVSYETYAVKKVLLANNTTDRPFKSIKQEQILTSFREERKLIRFSLCYAQIRIFVFLKIIKTLNIVNMLCSSPTWQIYFSPSIFSRFMFLISRESP